MFKTTKIEICSNKEDWLQQRKDLLLRLYTLRPEIGYPPFTRNGVETQLYQYYKQLWIEGELTPENSFLGYLLKICQDKDLYILKEKVVQEILEKGVTPFWELQVISLCVEELVEPYEHPKRLDEVELRLFHNWVGIIRGKMCNYDVLLDFERKQIEEDNYISDWKELYAYGGSTSVEDLPEDWE